MRLHNQVTKVGSPKVGTIQKINKDLTVLVQWKDQRNSVRENVQDLVLAK